MRILLVILIILNFFMFMIYDHYLNSYNRKYSPKKSVASYKVLCIVITTETNIAERALAIWKSWANYNENYKCSFTQFACIDCHKLRNIKEKFNFFKKKSILDKFKYAFSDNTTSNSDLVQVAHLPIIFIYSAFKNKYLQTFRIVFRKYGYKYKWSLFTSDETFIFVKNLFKFIDSKPSNNRVLYGSMTNALLFNQESLKQIYIKITRKDCANILIKNETKILNDCIAKANLKLALTKDALNRDLFLTKSLEEYKLNLSIDTILNESKNNDCCSNETISFNNIDPQNMMLMYLYGNILKRF